MFKAIQLILGYLLFPMALVAGVLIGSSIGGCSVVPRIYDSAEAAVTHYCGMSRVERAMAQLVISGKVYDSGICTIVNNGMNVKDALAVAAVGAIEQKRAEAEHILKEQDASN